MLHHCHCGTGEGTSRHLLPYSYLWSHETWSVQVFYLIAEIEAMNPIIWAFPVQHTGDICISNETGAWFQDVSAWSSSVTCLECGRRLSSSSLSCSRNPELGPISRFRRTAMMASTNDRPWQIIRYAKTSAPERLTPMAQWTNTFPGKHMMIVLGNTLKCIGQNVLFTV